MAATLNDDVQFTTIYNGTLTIVGVDVSVDQTAIGYTLPDDGTVPQAVNDVAIYGDVVTLAGDLVLPGRSLSIVARTLQVPAPTWISVSGGDPATTYAAGDPPAQTNQAYGAAGTAGGAATAGMNAGSLSVYAQQIEVVSAGAVDPTARTLVVQQALQGALSGAAAAWIAEDLGTLPLALAGGSVGFESATMDVTVSGMALTGFGALRSLAITYDPTTNAVTVTSPFQGAIAGSLTLSSGSTQLETLPLSTTVTATATLTYTLGDDGVTLASSTPTFTISGGSLTIQLSGLIAVLDQEVQDLLDGQLADALTSLASGTLTPALTTVSGGVISSFVQGQVGSGAGLTLLAIGGRGGRGQDGADGVGGAPGPAGQDDSGTVLPVQPPPSECVGGEGGQGGTGGDAGASGVGGASGVVTVGVVEAGAPVAYSAIGGLGGDSANAGSGGPGGPGGPGGTYYVGVPSGPVNQATAPPGPTGPVGAFAADQGAFGGSGTDGSGGYNGGSFASPGTFGMDQMAPLALLAQLQVSQQAASLAYLNAQTQAEFQDVTVRYQWLYGLTTPFTTSSPPANTLSATDIAVRQAMGQSVGVELSRLVAGLDYFGNPFDYVPVLTIDSLQDNVTLLISLGQTIQDQLTAFQNQEQAIAALQATVSALQGDDTRIAGEITTIQQQITQTSTALSQMATEIANQQVVVSALLTEEQQEYIAKQTSCSFSDVVKALGSIVQLASAAAAETWDLTKATTIEGNGVSIVQQIAGYVQQVKMAKATNASLSAAWQSIEALVSDTDPDAAKILVAEKDFDGLLNKYYSNLQSTPALEAAIQAYVGLIQTRNQMVANFTRQYLQLNRLEAQQTQNNVQIEDISTQLASIDDPSLPAYIAYMQVSLQNTLNDIIDELYFENQAYEYWSLTDNPLQIAGVDIGTLATTAETLATDITNAMTGVGRPPDPFQQVAVTLDATTYPTAFTTFAKTGVLTVAIPVGALAALQGYNTIIAQAVAVSLEGVTPPPGSDTDPTLLNVTLVQVGPDSVVDGSGNTWTFTHDPRPVSYEFDYTTNVTTVAGQIGDSQFVGLSPFSTWMIDFTASQNAWLAPSLVTGVTLTFSGTAYGPPQVKAKA